MISVPLASLYLKLLSDNRIRKIRILE